MNAHCESVSATSSYSFEPETLVKSGLQCTPITVSTTSADSTADIGWFAGSINRIKTYLHARKMQKIDRDAFRHLAKLDESILQDIGVSRADVEWAMKLPISHNASEALQLISRGYNKRA